MGQGNREGHRTETGSQTTKKKNEKHIKNNNYWRSKDWVGTDNRSFHLPANPKRARHNQNKRKIKKFMTKQYKNTAFKFQITGCSAF